MRLQRAAVKDIDLGMCSERFFYRVKLHYMPIEKGKSEILFCASSGGVICKGLPTTVLLGASLPAPLFNEETDLERGNDLFRFTQAI